MAHMKRLLITGGCGFVGVNLIDVLRRGSDVRVVVLDDLSLGKKEYLDPYHVEFIEGSICDAGVVERAMQGADGIVHLAADTRVIESIKNPVHNFQVNAVGTFTLLEAARKLGVRQIVFASTGGAIIGEAAPPVHEGLVPRPISPYGASKLCGEGYLCAYHGAYGIKTVALRFSNVYGPRSFHKGSVVAQFFKNILACAPIEVFGDGTQSRDYVYVDDIAAAIVLALECDVGGKAYHLGSGVPTSVNALLQAIRETIAPYPMPEIRYLPSRPGEVVHTHSRIDLAMTELRFRPTIDLRTGLRNTWEWFQAHWLAPASS